MREKLPMSSLVTTRGNNFGLSLIILEAIQFEGTGTGGVFNVVMIECPNTPKGQLSEQVFYENGFLCEYQHGNLNVETIHDRVNQLGNIAQGL